ncbi:MAG: transporter [Desulfobacteraceae bacterium]|nr:transporter [Desulfobacteraceae bacterium]MCB9494838.1 transporter [Desulfobacteraceae bacterium]
MKKIFINAVLLFLFLIPSAFSYDLPSVNLGFTSFLDGGPPAGPGLYFAQYIQYWNSDKLTDQNGDRALPSFADEKLDAWISLTQFIYQSDREIARGIKPGLDIIIPSVSLDMSYKTGNPNFPQDNGSGIGDILVGPYIQWDPVMGNQGPLFVQRIEFQFILPTGKYDKDKALNPGSNFFSFNPYWSGTLFLNQKTTMSARIHYLWNDENDDTNVKAGQAVHANFALAYELVKNRFRAGINGYWLKQITESEINGKKSESSKEQVFAAGPGCVYHISKDNHIFINSYFETNAENRPEGFKLNLRWVHHF